MSIEKPKMYQNKTNKKFNNTQKVYSTMYEDNNNRDSINNKNIKNYNIEQKINNIFKSPTYIYKIDVIIETDQDKLEKRIIGKTKNNIITIENEYIPIDKIRDIYLK